MRISMGPEAQLSGKVIRSSFWSIECHVQILEYPLDQGKFHVFFNSLRILTPQNWLFWGPTPTIQVHTLPLEGQMILRAIDGCHGPKQWRFKLWRFNGLGFWKSESYTEWPDDFNDFGVLDVGVRVYGGQISNLTSRIFRWFNKRGLKDSSTPCSGINGERLKSISDLFLHGQHFHSHIHQRNRRSPSISCKPCSEFHERIFSTSSCRSREGSTSLKCGNVWHSLLEHSTRS